MAAITPEVVGRKPRNSSGRQQAERLVYTVPEAGRLLGLSRNAAYDAAKRGEIPTLRFGRLLLVPKILLHRMLGMSDAATIMTAKHTEKTSERESAEIG